MKENVVPTQTETPSKALSPRKSLIPMPKDKISGNREPLTPLQKSGTTTEMVGRQPSLPLTSKTVAVSTVSSVGKKERSSSSSSGAGMSTSTPKSKSKLGKPSNTSTPIGKAFAQMEEKKRGVKAKAQKTFVEKEVQTDHPDVELVTGEEAPESYWKELAETRRVALEEALIENEILSKKVEDLEKENRVMEEMVEHAKSLAEIINSMSDDSGIAADASGVAEEDE